MFWNQTRTENDLGGCWFGVDLGIYKHRLSVAPMFAMPPGALRMRGTRDTGLELRQILFQPLTSTDGRVLGILCIEHEFNFAIWEIPSSTMRKHP